MWGVSSREMWCRQYVKMLVNYGGGTGSSRPPGKNLSSALSEHVVGGTASEGIAELSRKQDSIVTCIYTLRFLCVFLASLGVAHTAKQTKKHTDPQTADVVSAGDVAAAADVAPAQEQLRKRRSVFSTAFVEALLGNSKYPTHIQTHLSDMKRRSAAVSNTEQKFLFARLEWGYLLLCSTVALPFELYRTTIMRSLRPTLLNTINNARFFENNLVDRRSLNCWTTLVRELIQDTKSAPDEPFLFEICWPFYKGLLTTPQQVRRLWSIRFVPNNRGN